VEMTLIAQPTNFMYFPAFDLFHDFYD